MLPEWVTEYVGLPWQEGGRSKEGCDCWGIPFLVYQDRLGVELPAYTESYSNTADRKELADLIADRKKNDWLEVERGKERRFDLILFQIKNYPCHVGLVLVRGIMLHQQHGIRSAVESYERSTQAWTNRLVGIYRHVLLSP